MGREICDSVGASAHKHDTERQHLDVLLKLKIAIKSDENITDATCATQEIAVLDAGPTKTMYCLYVMPNK